VKAVHTTVVAATTTTIPTAAGAAAARGEEAEEEEEDNDVFLTCQMTLRPRRPSPSRGRCSHRSRQKHRDEAA
jgi:hypothetical protein